MRVSINKEIKWQKKHWSRAKRVTNVSFVIFLCLCKKCDTDSLVNSISFYVTNWLQFGPNSHRIAWLFHVIYPGFICFPCLLEHDMDFIEVWFPWHLSIKWWDFHRIWCLWPNCHKKNEKLRFTFFTGIYFYFVNVLFRMEYDKAKSYIMYFNFTFHKVIKAFAQTVHTYSICCGQVIRLVTGIVLLFMWYLYYISSCWEGGRFILG